VEDSRTVGARHNEGTGLFTKPTEPPPPTREWGDRPKPEDDNGPRQSHGDKTGELVCSKQA